MSEDIVTFAGADNCPCTRNCPRHGNCAACVANHRVGTITKATYQGHHAALDI